MSEPIVNLTLPLSSVNVILQLGQQHLAVAKVIMDVERQAQASLDKKADE